MTWDKKYDKCNLDNQGYLIIFGEHYSAKDCHTIIKEEKYDDHENYSNFIRYIWVHFGIGYIDGEKTTGWFEIHQKPSSMRGRILATMIYTKKQYRESLSR